MSASKDILNKELNAFVSSVRETLRVKGIDNTLEASNSLRVEMSEKGGAVYGVDYFYFLDKGRKPGKFPPVKNMRDWVRTKLGITEPKELARVAYLVGRKISREGTSIYKDNSKGLQLDKLIFNFTQNLAPKLEAGIAADIVNKLNSKNNDSK